MPKTVAAIQTEHTTEWHWEKFAEFCRFKAEVKEPSPHMQMIGELTKGQTVEEKIWFIGMYANFYNIPSALFMAEEWPWERARRSPEAILPWLEDNWAGTATRTERRTVRSPGKMAECLRSYIEWAQNVIPHHLGRGRYTVEQNDGAYDAIWQEAEADLRYMGRYIIIRLLEAMHRFVDLEPRLYDIRSIGGWSPKLALGLLYPDHLPLLLSSDTRENVARVDSIAFAAMDKFALEYNTQMSPYVFAAMLCEYRVAYEKRHQYPGWTIDQEPAYFHKTAPFWMKKLSDSNSVDFAFRYVSAINTKFVGARYALFPRENLGESPENGWIEGTRVEPRSTLRDYGYNWSDKRYDYNATVASGSFAEPVRRTS